MPSEKISVGELSVKTQRVSQRFLFSENQATNFTNFTNCAVIYNEATVRLKNIALSLIFGLYLVGCTPEFAGISFKSDQATLESQGFKCNPEIIEGDKLTVCMATEKEVYLYGYNVKGVKAVFREHDKHPYTIDVTFPHEAEGLVKSKELLAKINSQYKGRPTYDHDYSDVLITYWQREDNSTLQFMSKIASSGSPASWVTISVRAPNASSE